MLKLLKAETRRTLARKLTWVTLIFIALGIAAAFFGNWLAIRPISETDRVHAQTQYAQVLQKWQEDVKKGTDRCHGDKKCEESTKPQLSSFLRQPESAKNSLILMAQISSWIAFVASFVLCASLFAAEFTTGSISNYLSFAPNRIKVFTSKLISSVFTSLSIGLVTIGLTVIGAFIELLISGTSLIAITPGIETAFRGLVIAAIGGCLGISLAGIFKNSAATIGIFFGYLFVYPLILMLISLLGFKNPNIYLPDTNLTAILNNGFTNLANQSTANGNSTTVEVLITWQHGVVYWIVLLAILIGSSLALFKHRDMS